MIKLASRDGRKHTEEDIMLELLLQARPIERLASITNAFLANIELFGKSCLKNTTFFRLIHLLSEVSGDSTRFDLEDPDFDPTVDKLVVNKFDNNTKQPRRWAKHSVQCTICHQYGHSPEMDHICYTSAQIFHVMKYMHHLDLEKIPKEPRTLLETNANKYHNYNIPKTVKKLLTGHSIDIDELTEDEYSLESFDAEDLKSSLLPFHLEKAITALSPPSEIWTPRNLMPSTVTIRKASHYNRLIEILESSKRRHVQGDTGANVSATNDITILWNFQPLAKPINITTYDGNETSPCQAVGRGIIKIVANDNLVLEFEALYIPNSTGTIISPDHFMQSRKDIESFTHFGSKSGRGHMQFGDIHGCTVTRIDMIRRDGLWYTANKIVVNPHPTLPIPIEDRDEWKYIVKKCRINSAKEHKTLELWHQRYGHIGNRALAATSQCVEGMPPIPSDTSHFACPFCDQAKIKKSPGAKESTKETVFPGADFHMDLGFISGSREIEILEDLNAAPKKRGRGRPRKKTKTEKVIGRQGHTCFLLIICAATRYIWAFPLKSKQPPIDIIDKFLERHGAAHNRNTKKISTSPNGALAKSKSFALLMAKREYETVEQAFDFDMDYEPVGAANQFTIRTDNGGELAKSEGIQEVCAKHGYNLETTAPGTSRQNGLAERPNRTLKERVRCLLYTANLGAEFWADALLHAVWLYNRTFHRWLGRTPFEAYTGRRPYVDKLITFGGRITAKTPADKRTDALDKFSNVGIFLGFGATTEKIKYWDEQNQNEKFSSHHVTDEIHYGTDPAKRPPAAKHLIEVITGVPHSELSSHNMKEQPFCLPCTDLKKKGERTALPRRGSMAPPLPLSHLSPQAIIDDSPLPYTATAAKVEQPSNDKELIQRIETLDITLNALEPAISETIDLHGQHLDQGFHLIEHSDFKDTVVLKDIAPGSVAARQISKWKSRLRGSIVRMLDEITITSPAQFRQVLAKKREENKFKHATMTIQFARPRWQDLNGEGLPSLAFDQLNVVAHHLSAMDTDSPSWNTSNSLWPPIRDGDIAGVINKGAAVPKLTRRRLKSQDDWQKFKDSEWVQLNKYHNQGMFGKPCPRPQNAVVLPWVWSYVYKTNPVTLESEPKSRGTCNGGKQHGKIVTLAETYAACVEQPAHRLTWALIAALDYVALGTDVGNAFAEADGPDEPFYMVVDDQFREWWTEHLQYDDIPPGYVIPILKNLQGHPEGPRLWNKHIDRIITKELGFDPTTHEPCLYFKRNKKGKLILILRQVDDFLIAAPTLKECQSIRDTIQTKMANPLNDLGIIKRFNGLDIDQTTDYVKLSCETYINKIVSHHGWQDLPTKDLPIPMREDSTTLTELQTTMGPLDDKERKELEHQMGFNYRQAIGELIFAMSTCRVDIASAVIQLAQHAANPAACHYKATKHVFAYLNATKEHGLYYWRPRRNSTGHLPTKPHPTPVTNPQRLGEFPDSHNATTLHGATDATWGNDKGHRRSVSGVAILLAGAVVYYRCQLQPTVALSSTESEFAAMADAGKAALYLRSILNQLGVLQLLPTILLADNAGAIAIANAQQPTRRTKHVELKHFAILQWTEEDRLRYEPTKTQYNYSDILTKPLGRIKFYEQTDIIMGRRRPIYSTQDNDVPTADPPQPHTCTITSVCCSTPMFLRFSDPTSVLDFDPSIDDTIEA